MGTKERKQKVDGHHRGGDAHHFSQEGREGATWLVARYDLREKRNFERRLRV